MKYFKTIKGKLVAIIMGVVFFSLSTAFGLAVLYQVTNFQKSTLKECESILHALAPNISEFHLRGRTDSAVELTRMINSFSLIKAFKLFDKDDEIVLDDSSIIDKFDDDTRYPHGIFYEDSFFHITLPLNYNYTDFGHVYFVVSNQNLLESVKKFSLTALVIFFILLILSFFIANVLQKSISHRLVDVLEGYKSGSREISVDGTESDELENSDELEMLNNLYTKLENQIQNTQAQLVESGKMAAVGEMAAGIAHEINNPLTVILGNVIKIKNRVKKYPDVYEEVCDTLDKISLTVSRIAKIVSSLRKISRKTEGEVFENTFVSEIIEEALDLTSERFRVNQIELLYTPLDQNIQIYCNSIQVSQVLINLLNNAFDAVSVSEEKWVKLYVKDKGDEGIQFCVENAGEKISLDLIHKIMNPFFTTKPVGQGTGLGLSISSSIASQHDAKFYVDEDCEYTRFVFSIAKAS